MSYQSLLERGLLPDALVRREIRGLLRRRLAEERASDAEEALAREERLVAGMRESPVTLPPAEASVPHGEVPPEFHGLVLGGERMSTPGHFSEGVSTLDAAESAMLALACERARLEDGQNVLDLGCGWGALALRVAARFPGSRVVAVARSREEKAFVDSRAAERGLANVKAIACDLNAFDPATGPAFDRVVSVGTFEQVRNWPELLARIASWLKPEGRLFLQVRAHRELSYPFVARDEAPWLARSLFDGGLMPSDHLVLRFPEHLLVEARWRIGGTHAARTAEAWLANLDRNRREARKVLAKAYGPGVARRKLAEWRNFLLASAELGAFAGGNEWLVSQYRLRRRYA